MRQVLICLTMLTLAGCSNFLPAIDLGTGTLCDGTKSARQDHAAALGPLDSFDPVQRHAKQTGAHALGGVAGGCGEI